VFVALHYKCCAADQQWCVVFMLIHRILSRGMLALFLNQLVTTASAKPDGDSATGFQGQQQTLTTRVHLAVMISLVNKQP